MTETASFSDDHIERIVVEQIDYFKNSEIIKSLASTELLLGSLALSYGRQASLSGSFSAKFNDNPRTDTLTAIIDKPTLIDMADELSQPDGLDDDDIIRMYCGIGLANFLIVNSLFGAARAKRAIKFAEAMSEPQGLYASTMDSEIFDAVDADNAVKAIVTDGHRQTTHVNSIRLKTGMFIEVQPEAKVMREKVVKAFQGELASLFAGQPEYVDTAVDYVATVTDYVDIIIKDASDAVEGFNISEADARALFVNNIEEIVGLSFPMDRTQVRDILKILATKR